MEYAKIIVKGSPISKSNFKLSNQNGRAILPYNTGTAHDRYALYEQEIAYTARVQNPNVVFTESLIAILKVYYKSEKRHPDTINIPKSIFDGVEKSGIIVNDAQIRRIIIEEFYDSDNPRFELELYAESKYRLDYSINILKETKKTIEYKGTKKSSSYVKNNIEKSYNKEDNKGQELDKCICDICKKKFDKESMVSANKGNLFMCRTCFKKMF